jgi:hypothetical protein
MAILVCHAGLNSRGCFRGRAQCPGTLVIPDATELLGSSGEPYYLVLNFKNAWKPYGSWLVGKKGGEMGVVPITPNNQEMDKILYDSSVLICQQPLSPEDTFGHNYLFPCQGFCYWWIFFLFLLPAVTYSLDSRLLNFEIEFKSLYRWTLNSLAWE